MQMPESEEIESFYAKKNLASILGNDDFKEWVTDRFKNLRFKQDVPASKELAVSRDTIRELVCESFKVEAAALMTSHRGTENIPRDVAIYLQRKYCGQTLAELGIDYEMASYSSVSSAFERAKSKLLADSRMREKVLRIEKQLNKGQRET